MTEWVLALFIQGANTPAVIAYGYESAEQCLQAGKALEQADKAARGIEKLYSLTCTEQSEKP